MKTGLLFSAAVLILAAPLPAEWTQFASPKAGFQAVFPATPQETVQSIDTALGPIPYTTYMAEVENGNVAFGVAYNDYPDEVRDADPEGVLDGGRDGAKENLGGTIVSETNITYRGHPGREFYHPQ